MADDLIPPDVREFVLAYIESIAHLEALLLLVGKPQERWTDVSVSTQLYVTSDEAKSVLEQLCASGLAACERGVYWFNGEPSGQREIVERLAELYARHLIPVTNLVHSRPPSVRAFADAFKLRKDR